MKSGEMIKKLLIGLPILTVLGIGIYIYTYNPVPKCSDEAVIDVLEKRFLGKPDKESIKSVDEAMKAFNNYKGKLDKESITTINEDSETGAYTCQASMRIYFNGPEIPFIYHVSLSDDGEEFYVRIR